MENKKGLFNSINSTNYLNEGVVSHGKLFVIESGTDGAGKATQTEMLYNALVNKGYSVIRITFPNYESDSSSLVKMYLRGEFGSDPQDVNPYIASQFYAVDRFASYKKYWGKDYDKGTIIIADRYSGSNAVHQAVKFGNKEEKNKYLDWLWDLEHVKNKIPVATETIFLDLPPKVSEKLRENRNNKFTGGKEQDIHESNKEYLEKCYDNACYVADKYRWKKVDCAKNENIRSREDIHREVLNHVLSLLK